MKKATVFDEYAVGRHMPPSVPATLAPLVQVPSGGHILDVGCSDGRFLAFCREAAPRTRCVGIEISWVRVQHVALKPA